MKNTRIDTRDLKQAKQVTSSNKFIKLALSSAISAALFATQASAATYGARIIGGADATPNTYPWIVSVQNKAEGEHFCGASLIAEKYVLTAAHCIESERAEDIQVVISEYDLQQSSEHEEKLAVKNIYMHQQYNDDNDIAILELASATNKTPVKLADSSLLESLAVGSPFTVMGWGNLLAAGEQFPNILQEVQVPLVSAESCKSSYAKVDMEITDNMLCAGLSEGGKDSCQGDSGGPLVYQRDSDWFQTGVVSFGEGCAQADYPGVYTKVSNYSEWVAQVKAGEVPVHQPIDEGGPYDDGIDDDFDIDDLENDDLENQEWPEFEEQDLAFGLPPYIGFLAPGVNETTEEVIVMVNEHDSAVTIQGISLDNEQVFSVIENACDAVTLNKDDECEIKLGFNADNTEEHEATLYIATSDETNAQIELELFGIVMNELDLTEGFEDGYDGDQGEDWGDGFGEDWDEDFEGDFDGESGEEFGDEDYDGADNIVDGEWFFEGTPWSSDQESGFELACHTVSENDDSILMTEIEGPGTLTFDMSLIGDDAKNALVFMVDGEVVKTVSGQRSANSHTTELSEGEHQVSWVYQKAVENTAAATASISNMNFESAQDDENSEEDIESDGGVDSGDGANNSDKPVGELTLSELADEVGGAGSSDGLLLGLLALFGFGLRKRQK